MLQSSQATAKVQAALDMPATWRGGQVHVLAAYHPAACAMTSAACARHATVSDQESSALSTDQGPLHKQQLDEGWLVWHEPAGEARPWVKLNHRPEVPNGLLLGQRASGCPHRAVEEPEAVA